MIELGLTFPLQRFLKRRPPPYGAQPDRCFCWDLHVIRLRGCRCLLAVHCRSRYAFVRYDVPPVQWGDLPGLFREGLLESLLELDLCLDTSRQAQPLLDHAVNTRPSRCAGFEGLGTGLERMAAVLCEREAEI